jgi:hypothetical protein
VQPWTWGDSTSALLELAFLQGPLYVEVWLWEAEVQEYGLGRALCLEATGGFACAYAPV